MSVSVHIIGIVATNAVKHLAMLAIRNNCEIAGVSQPDTVMDYFNDEESDDAGQRVSIDKAIKGDPEYEFGALIDLKKVPEGVTHIRVYMD